MDFWKGFSTYIGVQGLIVLTLVAGFVYATLNSIALPDNYGELLALSFGFYFAKNGVGIMQVIRGNGGNS